MRAGTTTATTTRNVESNSSTRSRSARLLVVDRALPSAPPSRDRSDPAGELGRPHDRHERGRRSDAAAPGGASPVSERERRARALLESYARGSSREWVRSWWELIDADGDGLIDQEEMNSCVDLAISPARAALDDMARMSCRRLHHPLSLQRLVQRPAQQFHRLLLPRPVRRHRRAHHPLPLRRRAQQLYLLLLPRLVRQNWLASAASYWPCGTKNRQSSCASVAAACGTRNHMTTMMPTPAPMAVPPQPFRASANAAGGKTNRMPATMPTPAPMNAPPQPSHRPSLHRRLRSGE